MRIACLLLAAGAGSRFGGCKQLAMVQGKPLVRHSLEALATVFSDRLYVVLGAYCEEIQPAVEDLAFVITNDAWQSGLGSSIARGVNHIEAHGGYDGVLVALADQIQLTEADYSQLVERFEGDQIVAAHYADSAGVPAIFPAAMFPNLKQLEGDRGAKKILQDKEQGILLVPLPAAEVDVDVREDIPGN